jgi:alpha-tubulin suppressor-like RCC1 family protein
VGGSYGLGQLVTVNTTSPGAELHYTTNGNEPTPSDLTVAVGGTVTLTQSLTLKVIGWRTGWTQSATAVASYFLSQGTVAAPTFSPGPGSYASAQTVSISTGTAGAVIRYTRDGSTPDGTSTVYSGPLSVSATTVLTARAFKYGWIGSSATSGTYTISSTSAAAPVVTPLGGRIAAGTTVHVMSAESGVTLHYTLDGRDPTESDPTVGSGGTVAIGKSLPFKVKAWKAGLQPSSTTLEEYDVTGAVAIGAHHAVVLKSDDTLAAWGYNGYGQLGDNSTQDRYQPINVNGISSVVAVAAGSNYTLALRSDGTVWGWGSNYDGALGIGSRGTGNQSLTPVQVLQSASVPLTGVVAVAAAFTHALALKGDGTVWAWGSNLYGQLGMGDQSERLYATQIPGLNGVSAIAANGLYSLALQTNGGTSGSVWGWGSNYSGQLGDGTHTLLTPDGQYILYDALRTTPILVAQGVVGISAGSMSSFLRMADGSVLGAGINNHGQLGIGNQMTPQLTFTPVFIGVPSVKKFSASGVHTLALTDTGDVWASGFNNLGQLGDGTIVDKTSPVQTVLLHDVVDVAASQFTEDGWVSTTTHSIALTADGRVWTWGGNNHGVLGNGGTPYDAMYRPQPVQGFVASDRSWPDGDADGDGLKNGDELKYGCDPMNPDTNGDGIKDGAAIAAGLSCSTMDMDGDGVPNATEIANGTDPFRADTDGDGVPDGVDCFPLDPTRSSCPAPVPGDVTPPTITLAEPTSAVLVSSVP